MMPCSSNWKLFICCGINFGPLGLRSLHIQIKVCHHSFQPDRVRAWKLIFRAPNGLHFATLSWNLSSTKVWCWIQALVPFCSLCCPFLGGGKQPFCRGDLPSAGSHQHCTFFICTFKQSATVTSTSAGTGQSLWRRGFPSSWCWDQFVISSYALKCTCLVLAAGRAGVWRAALLCTGFVSSNTTGSAQRLSSVWPKQHLMIVNLSSHLVQSHFHPLHPFMGVLLINSNSRGNIKATVLPLGPFAVCQTVFLTVTQT